MNKALKLYIAFFVLIIIGIITLDASGPQPIDWTPTFAPKDKIPLGLYVLDQEINGLFPSQKLEKFTNTFYEFLHPKFKRLDSTYSVKGTILLISNEQEIDSTSARELCRFVGCGNSAYLSMQYFESHLMDTLKTDYRNQRMFSDTTCFNLCNKNFNHKTFKFERGLTSSYFSEIDTTTTTVLGYQKNGSVKEANFIKVPFKKGFFYLHTQPAAFSNYYILDEKNAEYCANILSYIPEGNIYWQVTTYSKYDMSSSPMRFILSNPALKWAWYLFLIGMATFIVFNAKRKQRIIPIKDPLPNTTVDFTKTIGNLYLQEGDHHNIIDKKIIYFLEKIRSDYMIDTSNLDENFVNRLHQKTGKDKSDIELFVKLIKKHRSKSNSTEKDVIKISKAIETLREKYKDN